MAKNVRGHGYASARSEPPKERIDICIGECLASSRSPSFDEQMVGFYLGSVRDPNIGDNLVDEIG